MCILYLAMNKTSSKTFDVRYSRHTSRCQVKGSPKTFVMTETQLLDWAAHTRLCGHTVNIKFL